MKKALLKFSLILAPIFGAFLVLVLTRGDSADWAELTVVSISANSNGNLRAAFTTRHSNGAGIETIFHVAGMESSGGLSRSGGGIPFFSTSTGSQVLHFDLNPERKQFVEPFTNSDSFARFLLRPGDVRRFRVGQPLTLYDFHANGKRYACFYRVVPSDTPWDEKGP